MRAHEQPTLRYSAPKASGVLMSPARHSAARVRPLAGTLLLPVALPAFPRELKGLARYRRGTQQLPFQSSRDASHSLTNCVFARAIGSTGSNTTPSQLAVM